MCLLVRLSFFLLQFCNFSHRNCDIDKHVTILFDSFFVSKITYGNAINVMTYMEYDENVPFV